MKKTVAGIGVAFFVIILFMFVSQCGGENGRPAYISDNALTGAAQDPATDRPVAPTAAPTGGTPQHSGSSMDAAPAPGTPQIHVDSGAGGAAPPPPAPTSTAAPADTSMDQHHQ